MAERSSTVEKDHVDGHRVVTWSGLAGATSDTGAPADLGGFPDRSIQAEGLSNSTLVLQGSNDGDTWYTLNDLLGNALSFSADALKSVLEFTKFVRPSISGGTDAAVVVTVVAR